MNVHEQLELSPKAVLSDLFTCGRCGGEGECCPCCSGFAVDHPELFGGAPVEDDGREKPICPECGGAGVLTSEQLDALDPWKRKRWQFPIHGQPFVYPMPK